MSMSTRISFIAATKAFRFNEEGRTHFLYHLRTSQVDKLPENRIQYAFDNMDFILKIMKLLKKRPIPTV